MDEQNAGVVVIGSGPAGLMAAEVIAAAGHSVLLVEQKSSLGRKFLMAGKSGLNLSKDVSTDALIAGVSPEAPQLKATLKAFDAVAVREWAEGLGQPVFTGSSGRIFPKTMKTSPLLRAILGRLQQVGVEARTRWLWQGWEDDSLVFNTPDGVVKLKPRATVLALGGASWARLGSDGKWSEHIPVSPFRPTNMGFSVDWSPHMARFFGAPIKPVRLTSGKDSVTGEFVLTRNGVEGGAVYAMSARLRDAMTETGTTLTLDLVPDRKLGDLIARLSRPQGSMTATSHLRKTTGLTGAKAALLREVTGATFPPPEKLARLIKALPLPLTGMRPIDEAISTAGGVKLEDLDNNLMLKNRPGTFLAGEMLDWEAPTGGYLITTCLATGRHAGQGLVSWLDQNS